MLRNMCLCVVLLSITGCASYMEQQAANKKRDRLFGLDAEPTASKTDSMIEQFKLSNPNVSKKCLPWRTNGNELVQAHCVWTIQGSASWQKTNQATKTN